MSLNVCVKVPVTVSDNKFLEQHRIRVNGVPQAEDEIRGPLYDLNQVQQALEEARAEGFDQGVQEGLLDSHDYWAGFAFAQQRPPMNNQYPIRPGLGGGLGGLGLGRNRNPQQPQQNQPPLVPQAPNLNDRPQPWGGFDEFARRVLAGEYDHEVEEAHRVGSTYNIPQPGRWPGLFGNTQGSPEMSGANPNATNNVWMRGGCGGSDDSSSDDPPTPCSSRKPPKNQQSNAPLQPSSGFVPPPTIYSRESPSSSSRPSQAGREERNRDELPLDIDFVPVVTRYPWESLSENSRRLQAKREAHIRKEIALREAARRLDAGARSCNSQNPQQRPQKGQGNAGDKYICLESSHCPGCQGI